MLPPLNHLCARLFAVPGGNVGRFERARSGFGGEAKETLQPAFSFATPPHCTARGAKSASARRAR